MGVDMVIVPSDNLEEVVVNRNVVELWLGCREVMQTQR